MEANAKVDAICLTEGMVIIGGRDLVHAWAHEPEGGGRALAFHVASCQTWTGADTWDVSSRWASTTVQ